MDLAPIVEQGDYWGETALKVPLTVTRFENLAAVTSRNILPRVRHVVAAIHVPLRQSAEECMLPIGLQLPAAAFRCGGELNLTTLQGGIDRKGKKSELPEAALMRWAKTEYNLGWNDVHGIRYLISTPVPVSPDSPKAKKYDYQFLHWHLLRTDRDFVHNPDKVKSFMWCSGPEQVFDYLSTSTRFEKIDAICEAIYAAIGDGSLPAEYGSLAALKSSPDIVAA